MVRQSFPLSLIVILIVVVAFIGIISFSGLDPTGNRGAGEFFINQPENPSSEFVGAIATGCDWEHGPPAKCDCKDDSSSHYYEFYTDRTGQTKLTGDPCNSEGQSTCESVTCYYKKFKKP